MSKFRTSILIIGLLIIVVAASLLTVLGLYMTGAVVTEKVELFYAVYNAEKEYDGTPLYATEYELVSGELLKGHRAVVDITGSQTDAGVSASSLSVRICDKDGYDVTDSYKIGVKGGSLKVTRKNIAVTLNDAEVMYNGSKVSFEDYTVTEGELVTGHKIAGSQNAQLITVNDELPSDLKPVVFDAAGNDVTKNYNVAFTMGTIRVVPRPVTVKPADTVKVYDGVEVTLGDVQILSGSLAEGQYFKGIEINYGETGFIDVCDVVTRITKLAIYQRVGSQEIDVTDNYEIDSSETGVVRIEKRKLTITAKSQSWVYDGTDHTVTNGDIPLSCEGLVPGELLVSVKQPESIKDVGTKEHLVTDIKLSQNASLDNYAVERISGTLTVVAREITIITPTLSKTYDGTPLEGASKGNEPEVMNISPNHEIRYDSESLLSITNHGSERNIIDCIIVDKDAPETDLTGNYIVTYFYGTLTVLKRAARVTTVSQSKVFDGETLYGVESSDDINAYNFVEGQRIEVPTGDDAPNITDVSWIQNAVTVTVYDGETDVTDNYDINYQYGYLEITRLNIKVKTKGETRAYNKEELKREDTEFVNLPSNLTAVLVEDGYPGITDVDRIENEVTFTLEYNGVEVDEKNYSIDYQYGWLEITPYNFSLKLKNYSLIYNGETLDLNNAGDDKDPFEGNVFNGDILPKEAFVLVPSRDEIKNAGSYSYTAELSEDYNPDNFNIKITGGTIDIAKCEVLVTLKSDKFEYNGEEWIIDYNTDITLRGVDGSDINHLTDNPSYPTLDTLFEVVSSGTIKNAGTYTYSIKFIDSLNDRNHVLYINGGNITIDRKVIYISLPDNLVKEYNGESQLPDISVIDEEYLIDANLTRNSFKIVSESGNVINASDKPYIFTAQMTDAREAENYDIRITQIGKIRINRCVINLRLSAVEAVIYDGESHIPELVNIIDQGDLPEHIRNIYDSKFVVKAVNGDIRNVGEYEYTVEFRNIADLDNYELNVVNGKININKCTVEVTLNDLSGNYNGEVHKLSLSDAVDSVICKEVETPPVTMAKLAYFFELYTWETIKDAQTYSYGIRFIDRNDAGNFTLFVNGSEGEEAEYKVIPVSAQLVSRVESQRKVYDGKIYTVDTVSAVNNNLISLEIAEGFAIEFGYTITVDCATTDAKAELHQAKYTNLRVYNSYGEDITRNFKVDYESVSVTVDIERRDITFTLDNYICTEDTKPSAYSPELKNCLGISSATPLLPGYRVSFENVDIMCRDDILTVYDFELVIIYNEEGDDVTLNFNITNDMTLTSAIIVIE